MGSFYLLMIPIILRYKPSQYVVCAKLYFFALTQIYTVDFTNPLDCNKQFCFNAHIGVVVLLGIIASNLIRTDSRDEKIHSSSCSHDELP